MQMPWEAICAGISAARGCYFTTRGFRGCNSVGVRGPSFVAVNNACSSSRDYVRSFRGENCRMSVKARAAFPTGAFLWSGKNES